MSMTTAATARKPQSRPYHHGNLRESLLEAAEAVLAERGVQGISLRDVAKAAGVSHAAPYHHFASLNDLLAAVAERGFTRLAQAMEKASGEPDARERLLRINEAYVVCACARPAQFRLMFGPFLANKSDFPALKAAADRAFGFLLGAASTFDPKDGPVLALTGWSLAHGLSNLLIDGALEGLPIKSRSNKVLARQLALRALGSGVGTNT